MYTELARNNVSTSEGSALCSTTALIETKLKLQVIKMMCFTLIFFFVQTISDIWRFSTQINAQ